MSGLAFFIFGMVKLHKLWEVGALHLIHNLLKTSLGPLSSIYCRKSLNILWRDLNEEYINVDPEEYVFYVVRNKDKKWNWHAFSLKRQCASFVSRRSRDLIAGRQSSFLCCCCKLFGEKMEGRVGEVRKGGVKKKDEISLKPQGSPVRWDRSRSEIIMRYFQTR